ncbi:HypC/HybG/HupF family hydrogenase formation chaperone [Rhodopseudomonas sp. BR0C11]|uniref:HypC/HybG/HupF family hydrogenase formation chaperone n=1 Tax=Rhodopseudomonas sp. BR0C11 TaxID=2269370 RepID=UPI0013E03C62|nr:HypC/HybG/HupF family hydrogenase formation chaperone [Rhodopseudomonas sp. BR0C11]NEV77541.1 HypC/HybG/HupF family hydrogenase formation chaperone [Rhodopseudomonas sp. BR0C11]
MCVGLPMTVISTEEGTALCVRRGEHRSVSTMLIGEVAPGDLLLVFIDSAIRRLDAKEARLIDDALDGVAAALEGKRFEHLFADLIDREPELPEHLRRDPQ